MKKIRWGKLIKKMYCRFQDDDIPALGAQLTYYLILAFFPFLIFLITLVSLTPITVEMTLKDLSRLLPANSTDIVNEVIAQTRSADRGTLLSFGMVVTLWAASNGASAVITAINKAYDQEETRPFWKVKGISILFTVALALVLIFSFALLVFGEILGRWFFAYMGFSEIFEVFWNFGRLLVPVVTMLLVFISLYHHIPNRRLKLREVIPGSVFSTLGWIAVSLIFSYYVNKFGNFANTYGSLGGIIALLIWLYWSSVILLLGGELNAALIYDLEGIEKPRRKRYC